MKHVAWFALVLGTITGVACGDDNNNNGATLADRMGIGAQCMIAMDCLQDPDHMFVSECLTTFKGGYCGLSNCTGDEGCPPGSRCVRHDDGVNYCFRVCATKDECNLNRTLDNASNCESSIDFVDGKGTSKACVPPSSG